MKKRATIAVALRLSNFQKLYLKQQRRVRRDYTPCAARTIAQLRRNRQFALAADPHSCHALILVQQLDHTAHYVRDALVDCDKITRGTNLQHRVDALQAFDDIARAQREFKWLVAII